MTTHKLRLSSEPFSLIANGSKTIESRLFDDKRRLINVGDELIFTNRDDSTQNVSAKVIGVLRFKTFHDLFANNPIEKFGGESVEWLENQINKFYTPEDQAKNGVIGIEFELL